MSVDIGRWVPLLTLTDALSAVLVKSDFADISNSLLLK